MDEFKEGIEKIKKQIVELERKYAFWSDCDMITYILDKVCDIDSIEIKKEDIEKNKTIYLLNRVGDTYRLKRMKEGE